MNTRANFAKAMVDDAYLWAIESYDREPTVFDQVFDATDSEGAYEQYTSALGPGTLTETAEADTINRVSAIEGFTVYVANRKFADELLISNESIDDNRKITNFLRAWAEGLGEAARQTKEQRHANIFNYGGYTAGHAVFNNDIPGVLSTYTNPLLCYDGVEFLNNSTNTRTAKHGGTYYNAYSSLDLSETNIQVLYQLLSVTNAFNEAGNRVMIRPSVILCQMGSDNWFLARRIVESMASISASHEGVTNLFKDLRVIGWAFLSSSTSWYLGVPKKGLRSLARTPLVIDYYEDQPKDAQVVRARVRFGCAPDNFRFWGGGNVATS